MITGAIFDLDGTILDSMPIWDTIGADYLLSLGIKPKEDLKETFKTFSIEQAAVYYQTHYGVRRSVGEIIGGVNAMIERFYREEAPLKAGVSGFLKKLKMRNVKLCVATATEETCVRASLAHHGVLSYFDAILTCTNVGAGKQDSAIYRAAQKKLGKASDEILVFEDAVFALQTAKRAGYKTVGVYDKSETQVQKMKEISDFYIEDFAHDEGFWRFFSSV